MIFRLSRTLNRTIQAGLCIMPLAENPYADWSASLFAAAHHRYILLSNTRSLYSVVMSGKGDASGSQFADRALSSIREFMQDDGQQFSYHRFIAPAAATVTFATSLDRSVTAAMNELIARATLWLTHGALSPFDVGFKLNEVLLATLGGPGGRGYARPREAFRTLLSTALAC
jgi:hypothetical protein